MKQVSYGCIDRSLKAYLHVERLTKPPASALIQNLSPSIYGWKDEPSHSRVPWSKSKVLLPTGGKDEPSHSRVSWSRVKSFYQQVEGRTKSLMSASVKT